MKKTGYSVIGAFVMLFLIACNLTINKTVRIADGTKSRGVNTVNGGIIIGDNCEVRGECRSVNGQIEMGRNSSVEELQTVNGRIRIDEDSVVDHDVESVNGSVRCLSGVEIQGGIHTINGKIKLEKTRVHRNITTINGNISLRERCVVRGDIIVKKTKGHSSSIRKLRIELSGGSVVHGDILVNENDIEVEVFISDDSKVQGRIENAEVIEDSGRKAEEGI
ncbi:MAG: hypothetical protein ACE5IR_09190 [bacterium]